MKKEAEVEQMIDELEGLAEVLLEAKKKAIPRRPLVVEFSGSPKAGKTTCVESLVMFLKRNGFRVKLVTERASICPVKNKLSPSFNMWTVFSTLAEITEVLSNDAKNVDVIVVDRGVFDSMCWFEWMREHERMDEENYAALIAMLSMQNWRRVIDLVYVFTVSPDASLKREYSNLLTRKRGGIMNKKTLASYKKVVEESVSRLSCLFRKIMLIDTTKEELGGVNYKITRNVLNALGDIVEERVGYLDASLFESVKGKNVFRFSELASGGEVDIKFSKRSEVESDFGKIQPIPVAIVCNKSKTKILTARKGKKSAEEGSPEHRSTLLYFGGHIRKEDSTYPSDSMGIMKYALRRELEEELGVSYFPSDSDPVCIYTPTNDKSRKHFAVCFLYINDSLESLKVDSNEFLSSSNRKPVKTVKELMTMSDVEEWGKEILRTMFDSPAIFHY